MASAIKYYYGINHYGERDKIFNKIKEIVKCPRCSKKET